MAFKITAKKNVEFKSIEDVYEELELLYDKAHKSDFSIGQALYTQSAFFTDSQLFADIKCQRRIKEYLFCEKFRTSLYPTMNETPCEIIDEFMIISQEHSACEKYDAEQKKDKK